MLGDSSDERIRENSELAEEQASDGASESGGDLFVGIGKDDNRQVMVGETLDAGGEPGGRTAVPNDNTAISFLDPPAETVIGSGSIIKPGGSPHLLSGLGLKESAEIQRIVPFGEIPSARENGTGSEHVG